MKPATRPITLRIAGRLRRFCAERFLPLPDFRSDFIFKPRFIKKYRRIHPSFGLDFTLQFRFVHTTKQDVDRYPFVLA
ncbi:MAG: hypothetical protein ACLUFV_04475 [Acutalibacteraceae bacterium]